MSGNWSIGKEKGYSKNDLSLQIWWNNVLKNQKTTEKHSTMLARVESVFPLNVKTNK